EEEGGERHQIAKLFHVEPAPEPAHRHLERVRPAVGTKRDRFAVQDHGLGRKPPDGFDDLGDAPAYVGEVSGEYPNLVTKAMDLDAGAVELPFDRGRTDPTDRLLEILGGLGEHRKDRTKQGQP